jgi:hypothetical protein
MLATISRMSDSNMPRYRRWIAVDIVFGACSTFVAFEYRHFAGLFLTAALIWLATTKWGDDSERTLFVAKGAARRLENIER